jgi:heterodisulfide reductase subunit B2
MKFKYYPGCSLEVTAKPYNHSTQEICRVLGVDLSQPPEWTCCGSSPALKMDRLLSTSLAAHNLSLLDKMGQEDVLIPCPFCYRRLLSAREELSKDQDLKKQVEDVIEAKLEDNTRLVNILEFLLKDVGLANIKEMVIRPLTGLKVLPYYGCFLVKPAKVTHFDDPEDPTSMDKVLEALGAEVLDWDFKTECCGSGLALSKTDKVVELSRRIIREAAWQGADAIVVVCQLCQANLDLRQEEISRAEGRKYKIPIIYLTQLVGLAFGLAPEKLGLGHHLVDPRPLLERKYLSQKRFMAESR